MPPSGSCHRHTLQRPYGEPETVRQHRGYLRRLDDLNLLRHMSGTFICLVPSSELDGPGLEYIRGQPL